MFNGPVPCIYYFTIWNLSFFSPISESRCKFRVKTLHGLAVGKPDHPKLHISVAQYKPSLPLWATNTNSSKHFKHKCWCHKYNTRYGTATFKSRPSPTLSICNSNYLTLLNPSLRATTCGGFLCTANHWGRKATWKPATPLQPGTCSWYSCSTHVRSHTKHLHDQSPIGKNHPNLPGD